MNFAVPVKMVFVNDNDNRCIFGVFGCDLGMVLSKDFVACVRQLNDIFVFYLISFFMNFAVPVKMVIVYDNCCISGVFVRDFGLVLSKVFAVCVRQLNAIF